MNILVSASQLRQGGVAVLVQEAHSDLDSDWDGSVGLAEFVRAHASSEDAAAAHFFNRTLDVDADGFLDVVELAQWVEPKGYSQVSCQQSYLPCETRNKWPSEYRTRISGLKLQSLIIPMINMQ